VEQDRVARRGIDAGDRVEADDAAGPEAARVDQPAARDDLRHGLDAVFGEPRRADDVGDGVAAVDAAVLGQVAEGVQVRADLRRGGDDVGHPVERADRLGVRHEQLPEVAAREHGCALVEHAPEVVQPPPADERERREPAFLRGVYSDDHGVRKLGNRVSPPSTKMVWPVM
jgi:hypothetical protein